MRLHECIANERTCVLATELLRCSWSAATATGGVLAPPCSGLARAGGRGSGGAPMAGMFSRALHTQGSRAVSSRAAAGSTLAQLSLRSSTAAEGAGFHGPLTVNRIGNSGTLTAPRACCRCGPPASRPPPPWRPRCRGHGHPAATCDAPAAARGAAAVATPRLQP